MTEKIDQRAPGSTEGTDSPSPSAEPDRVASVVLPAFKKIAASGPGTVGHFLAIGAGDGSAALAAVEVFSPRSVTLTDPRADVLEMAVGNVRNGLRPGTRVEVAGFACELVEPLLDRGRQFDLIYENLPATEPLTKLPPIPAVIRQYLLERHYALLIAARPLLTGRGRVLCSIDAPLSLGAIADLARAAGYEARLLGCTWKLQTDAADVIGAYARHEQQGGGPFSWYPPDVLEAVLGTQPPPGAVAIELELGLQAVNATTATELAAQGQPLGHTIAVIECRPR